jgi:hypothetical protein
MQKTILTLSIFLAFSFVGSAQCDPDQTFTMIPIPGVYPPNIPIPGIPLVGISDGQVNIPYSQTLTLVVLEDTTMDIGFVLDMIDPTITPLMNGAGISTTMTVDVNHVIYDISGLPNSLIYTCDINSCQYASGVDGCILIDGAPTQDGNFPIAVSMTINAQIPAIIDPLFGTTIFAGMAIDFPSFTAIEYNLLVTGGTAINEVGNYRSKVFPNPTSNQAVLSLISFADVVVYNILGKEVLIADNVKGDLLLSKNDIGKGVFYISVQSKNKTETIKLIIK